MRGTGLRSTGKSVAAVLCAACFLSMNLGAVSRAVAADPWETWPKTKTEPAPAMEQKPATATDANEAAKTWDQWPKKASEADMERKLAADADKAAKAGDAAEKKSAMGISYGTIGWIALGIAAAIGIGIAASGGGGDSGGGTVVNPGHH
ncbi:MAG: hypothetical protein IH611_00120 [Deltaproteobacteria bacterium]|nr:hypothetical protein [Deltaproteobacteria bacterium]